MWTDWGGEMERVIESGLQETKDPQHLWWSWQHLPNVDLRVKEWCHKQTDYPTSSCHPEGGSGGEGPGREVGGRWQRAAQPSEQLPNVI